MRTIDDFVDEATVVVSAMKACAERDGAQTGKNVMVKWLEPHKDCAAGSRLEINTVQIDNAARAVLAAHQPAAGRSDHPEAGC